MRKLQREKGGNVSGKCKYDLSYNSPLTTKILLPLLDTSYKLAIIQVASRVINKVRGKSERFPKVSKNTDFIPYGQPVPGPRWYKYVPESVDYYIENQLLLAKYCEQHNIQCLFLLNPTLSTQDKPLSDIEKKSLQNVNDVTNGAIVPESIKWWTSARMHYKRLNKQYCSNNNVRFIDLSMMFINENETMYLDAEHFSEVANYMIAKNISSVLLNWNNGCTDNILNDTKNSTNIKN